MPPDNYPFSVGKSLNVGIYDLQFAQHADDLIVKAQSEGKVLSVIQYKGRDVLRVSNKRNRLVEAFRHLTGFYTRNARSIQNYRGSLPSYIAPAQQNAGQSFVRAILDEAEADIQRHLASHPDSEIGKRRAAAESSSPAFNSGTEATSSSVNTNPQEQVAPVSAPIEQATAQQPVPKLNELITWFQNKRDRWPDEIIPGFEAEKSGEFIVFTGARVKSEMVEADGGSGYRPAGRKFEKVHLSIDRNQFAQTWAQLAPLLFSDKNPFLQFKVSTLVDDSMLQSATDKILGEGYVAEETKAHSDNLRRVSEGLQLTFYYTPPGHRTPREKVAKEARESASFLKEISAVSQSFAPGKVYGRTMQLSPYIDYREEAWGRGDTSKPVEQALSERPFDVDDQARLAQSPFFSELERAFQSK
jgi:hypothetical protein